MELSATRAAGWGFSPISFTEIDAYQRVMRVAIRPFEAVLIRALDRVAMRHVPGPKKGKGEFKELVDAKDGAGVASLFRSIAVSKKKKKEGGTHG